LDAVITNDGLRVYHCLTSGENVNTKIGPWAEAQLVQVWSSHDLANEIQIPFFVVSHTDHSLRPSFLHLAIYFNAISVIEVLMEQSINLSYENVWFGPVEVLNGQLQQSHPSEHPSTKNKNIYTIQELIDHIYRQGLHRIILSMKEYTWREECNQIRGKLLQIIQPRSAELEVYAEQRHEQDLSLIRDIKIESEVEYLQRTNNNNNHVPLRMLDRRQSVAANLRSMSYANHQRTTMRTKILDAHPYKYPWREHSIVRKLQGGPLIASFAIAASDEESTVHQVQYLGKEDAWLRITTHRVDNASEDFNTKKKPTMAERKAQFLRAVEAREEEHMEVARVARVAGHTKPIEKMKSMKKTIQEEATEDDDILGKMSM
jgi:hypothetical protein